MTQNEIYQFMGNFTKLPQITVEPPPAGATQAEQLTHMIQSIQKKGILKTAEAWEIYENAVLQIGLKLCADGLESEMIKELIFMAVQMDSPPKTDLQFVQKVITALDYFPSESNGESI
jgi:hypothetical protein